MLVLVVLGLVVLGLESSARGKGRVVRIGPQVQRMTQPHRLGRATLPVLGGFFALVGLALGVPIGSCVYWTLEGGAHAIGGVSILDATWHTALYSGAAAALATLMALPVALLAVRNPGRTARLLERSTFLVLAMPGIVIAFALSYFTERYGGTLGGHLYQSAPLLIVAYAILVFPLALVGVRASVAHAPVGLEEVAHSLGQGRLAVLWRVTLPLIGPGLAASFCLVLLAAVTELTATLILIPTGVQTLATQFWAYQSEPLLRPGRPVRPDDHRHRRGPELRAGPLLRPDARAGSHQLNRPGRQPGRGFKREPGPPLRPGRRRWPLPSASPPPLGPRPGSRRTPRLLRGR